MPTIGQRPSATEGISKALKGLSLREKVLIWALILISVILVMIFFLIIPANDRLAEAQSNREVLRTEQMMTTATIAAIPNNQALLESSQTRHAEYLLRYQAPLLPEDIDRMLTTLVQDCGFSASSLNLTSVRTESVYSFTPAAPSWEIPNPQNLNESAPGTAVGDEEEANANAEVGSAATDAGVEDTGTGSESPSLPPMNETDTPATPTTPAASASATYGGEVQCIDVQVTVIGYEENFYALLDRVVPLSWIKITYTTYTPPAGIFSGYGYAEQACTINFRIYINPEASAKQIYQAQG